MIITREVHVSMYHTHMTVGITILRLSLALVFLLTSWHIFRNPKEWSKYIKPWERKLIVIDPVLFMKLTGWFDATVGLLLLTPWLTWMFALIAALHMVTVVISVGIKGPEYRDVAILGACIALFFLTLPIHLFTIS